MNNVLALSIEIPDWLFHGPFWLGFCIATVIWILVFLYIVSHFNPFD
jgi:hypothetical protein